MSNLDIRGFFGLGGVSKGTKAPEPVSLPSSIALGSRLVGRAATDDHSLYMGLSTALAHAILERRALI